MESTTFWKKLVCKQTILYFRAGSSPFVNSLIMEETPMTGGSSSGSGSSSNNNDNNNIGSTPPTPTPSASNQSTVQNEPITPWLVNNININDAFKKYKQKASSMSTFKIETDLQEVLDTGDILFLAQNEHSKLKSAAFGLDTLENLCNYNINNVMETMDMEDSGLTNDEFITITRTINSIDIMSKSIREAKRDLLTLAVCMNGSKSNVVEGITNL